LEPTRPDLDPAEITERTKESVAKIREMADELRTVIEYEDRVAGDLMKQVPEKPEE
jgi:hypothetical protein